MREGIFVSREDEYIDHCKTEFEKVDESLCLSIKSIIEDIEYTDDCEETSVELGYLAENSHSIMEKLIEHVPFANRFAILNKLEINQSQRNKGYGKFLIEQITEDFSVMGAEAFGLQPGWPTWLEKQLGNDNKEEYTKRLEGFYRSFGFRTVSSEEVIIMKLRRRLADMNNDMITLTSV